MATPMGNPDVGIPISESGQVGAGREQVGAGREQVEAGREQVGAGMTPLSPDATPNTTRERACRVIPKRGHVRALQTGGGRGNAASLPCRHAALSNLTPICGFARLFAL
jgi:hypothetical protein